MYFIKYLPEPWFSLTRKGKINHYLCQQKELNVGAEITFICKSPKSTNGNTFCAVVEELVVFSCVNEALKSFRQELIPSILGKNANSVYSEFDQNIETIVLSLHLI